MPFDFPWNDRAGRFSTFKAVAFFLALLPALWIVWDAATGQLGSRPMTEAIHRSGDWAVRLLLVTLAITPLRRIAGWNRLIILRRMLGLFAFAYALAHLVLYAADQSWNLGRVASEIALRFYLTIGFVVLLGLGLLAATSTDKAIRRLGRRWQQLHRLIYPLTALALFHYFLQSKINASDATLVMGFFLLLMGWRAAHALRFSLRKAHVLAVIAILSLLGTIALEAAWYGLATGLPWLRVLAANWSLVMWPRPSFWVLLVGLAFVALSFDRTPNLLSNFVSRRDVLKL